MTFESFGIDPDILSALYEMEFKEPTPIQNEAVPLILQGHDLIALAETGSGKTAACAIPITHAVDTSSNHIQGLILVPTRELALQYATEAQKIGKYKKVKVFAVLGGEDMQVQRAKIKDGVHLLVATPGRLIDFIYNRFITLSHVKKVAIDEADEMLSLGFLEDLEFILNCLVQEHQTLLFSATMPDAVRDLGRRYMKSPKELSLINERASPKTLKHEFYYCRRREDKAGELVELLGRLTSDQCLIFVNHRSEAETLFRKLKKAFPSSDFIHGGLGQDIRNSVMQRFAKGRIRYLVATDIASRGLDFSRVTHVINVHLPMDKESYLHRSGRTARRGREGVAITLVSGDEVRRAGRFFENPNFINGSYETILSELKKEAPRPSHGPRGRGGPPRSPRRPR